MIKREIEEVILYFPEEQNLIPKLIDDGWKEIVSDTVHAKYRKVLSEINCKNKRGSYGKSQDM